MGKTKDNSVKATCPLEALSAEQAYSVGAAVGCLLKEGMPSRRAIEVTGQIAEFVRRGVAAQRAVEKIISAEEQKRNS